MTSNFTPEQQARIDRFEAIVRFASQQTGVVQVTTMKAQIMRLNDGTPRTEVTAVIEPAIVANWQPPQPEQIEYPSEDNNHETPTPDSVSANGVHAE